MNIDKLELNTSKNKVIKVDLKNDIQVIERQFRNKLPCNLLKTASMSIGCKGLKVELTERQSIVSLVKMMKHQYRWSNFIYFKYCFFQMYGPRIDSIAINLDCLTDEDLEVNSILCKNGQRVNIHELTKELCIIHSDKVGGTKEKVIMESNILDNTMIMLDKHRLFMINMQGAVRELDEKYGKVFMDFNYLDLSAFTGRSLRGTI